MNEKRQINREQKYEELVWTIPIEIHLGDENNIILDGVAKIPLYWGNPDFYDIVAPVVGKERPLVLVKKLILLSIKEES